MNIRPYWVGQAQVIRILQHRWMHPSLLSNYHITQQCIEIINFRKLYIFPKLLLPTSYLSCSYNLNEGALKTKGPSSLACSLDEFEHKHSPILKELTQ